jgi:hypothetical protein
MDMPESDILPLGRTEAGGWRGGEEVEEEVGVGLTMPFISKEGVMLPLELVGYVFVGGRQAMYSPSHLCRTSVDSSEVLEKDGGDMPVDIVVLIGRARKGFSSSVDNYIGQRNSLWAVLTPR